MQYKEKKKGKFYLEKWINEFDYQRVFSPLSQVVVNRDFLALGDVSDRYNDQSYLAPTMHLSDPAVRR